MLQAKVLRLLTSDRSKQVDTAEHIARWLQSMTNDVASGEIKAQLEALSDAIREGRWRPETQPSPLASHPDDR